MTERDLPPEYARDLEATLAARAKAMQAGQYRPEEWALADESVGRSVSDRVAAERAARVAMRDASHDVSGGADWRRVADTHIPREVLVARRAQPGPLAAAVERARQAVADLPAPRVSQDDESTRWSEDRARNDFDTLER